MLTYTFRHLESEITLIFWTFLLIYDVKNKTKYKKKLILIYIQIKNILKKHYYIIECIKRLIKLILLFSDKSHNFLTRSINTIFFFVIEA